MPTCSVSRKAAESSQHNRCSGYLVLSGKRARGDDVHPSPQQRLQLFRRVDDVEEVHARLHVHQQVYVAVRRCCGDWQPNRTRVGSPSDGAHDREDVVPVSSPAFQWRSSSGDLGPDAPGSAAAARGRRAVALQTSTVTTERDILTSGSAVTTANVTAIATDVSATITWTPRRRANAVRRAASGCPSGSSGSLTRATTAQRIAIPTTRARPSSGPASAAAQDLAAHPSTSPSAFQWTLARMIDRRVTPNTTI